MSNNPPSPPDVVPDRQLAIIKLSANMLENIFVSPIVDSVVVDYNNYNISTLYYDNHLCLSTPTDIDSVLSDFATTQLSILGKNPYILLNNGFAIIDWKWAHFHPLSGAFRNVRFYSPRLYSHKSLLPNYSTNPTYMNGFLANEEYYILPVGWNDLTALTTIWSLERGTRIDIPEVRYISQKKIEEYGEYGDGLRNMELRYNINTNDLYSLYELYLRDSELFQSYMKECNELYTSYVTTLNEMILNKDFEKWTLLRK